MFSELLRRLNMQCDMAADELWIHDLSIELSIVTRDCIATSRASRAVEYIDLAMSAITFVVTQLA